MSGHRMLAASMLLVAALAMCSTTALPSSKPGVSFSYRGNATFNSKEFGIDGHCSFGPSKGLNLPWKSKVLSVAVNSKQYKQTPVCGLCVEIHGLAKNSPFKQGATYGMVVDECTKCKFGDIVVKGDHGGYHPVQWKAVQCDVGNGKFQYSFQGSNDYYMKVAITNTRLPLASVDLRVGNKLHSFQRTTDNYWEYSAQGQIIRFPITLSMKSITNDVVVEKLSTKRPFGTYKGKSQFPYKPKYAAVLRR